MKESKSRWLETARPEQVAPGLKGSIDDRTDWDVWLYLAGRGAGKTRAGAELVIEWARSNPGCIIHLVSATVADYRDVMVDGESGILSCSPSAFRPRWIPSRRRLEWPNGSIGICFAAEEPRRLRGPQCHFAWCDEVVAWERAETWDMLRFGLRLGKHPKVMVSTTPKPIPLLRDLIKDPRCIVTKGSTFDNVANLSPTFLHAVKQKYEGTRLGRQELYAELLEDAAGALWCRADLDDSRVSPEHFAQCLSDNELTALRVVVAVDPTVSSSEGSDETGIVVVARCSDGKAYVLHDASGKLSPSDWAKRAVACFNEFRADRIVAEANQGGDLVEMTLRSVQSTAPIKLVHASRGKRARAEPVAALSEQRRIVFVGMFPKLEDQLCTWDAAVSTSSPDRLDAFVWAITELMFQPTVSRNFLNLAPF